ncbi:MAG: sigma-54 dependent transcriptional regulator [Candidatus Cloacimonetes bacterium]|nr:sigma-54 dependent transcriptional regulator [Candidatus Cloacimonadota bacterium]
MNKILIVDDDFAVRKSLEFLLKNNGFKPILVSNPQEAIFKFENNNFDLIVMDMNFSLETSGKEGLELLKKIKLSKPEMPVVLITAWGSISLAVEGMRLGAVDFITKPWNNDNFIRSIQTAISLSNVNLQQNQSRKQLDQKFDYSNIIGKDSKMLKILETIGRICKTDASVLIVGESGTGKELIAEAIHKNSIKRNQPFVKVNLGGISSTLFESEMFGHKRGAFTDARNDRVGRFEMADKGTIFLDEIAELDMSSQVKLLRVLQDRSFEVLGSSRTKNVDVRVISATNRHLDTMIENNEFREDLFYRINLITLNIPPLRERKEDIPLLLEYFISNLRRKYKLDNLEIDKSAIDWLKNLSLPGNIRELKNLVERVVLVSTKNKLDADDFISQFQPVKRNKDKSNLPDIGEMSLEEIEKKMIIKALKFHDKNISKVAKSLGLSRAALYRRMEKFKISM